MRCAICDATLSPESVQWSHTHNDWEPCPSCLVAISEVFNTDMDEEEITRVLEDELADGPDIISLEDADKYRRMEEIHVST